MKRIREIQSTEEVDSSVRAVMIRLVAIDFTVQLDKTGVTGGLGSLWAPWPRLVQGAVKPFLNDLKRVHPDHTFRPDLCQALVASTRVNYGDENVNLVLKYSHPRFSRSAPYKVQLRGPVTAIYEMGW